MVRDVGYDAEAGEHVDACALWVALSVRDLGWSDPIDRIRRVQMEPTTPVLGRNDPGEGPTY